MTVGQNRQFDIQTWPDCTFSSRAKLYTEDPTSKLRYLLACCFGARRPFTNGLESFRALSHYHICCQTYGRFTAMRNFNGTCQSHANFSLQYTCHKSDNKYGNVRAPLGLFGYNSTKTPNQLFFSPCKGSQMATIGNQPRDHKKN